MSVVILLLALAVVLLGLVAVTTLGNVAVWIAIVLAAAAAVLSFTNNDRRVG